MGCDLINEGGKKLRVIIRDYNSSSRFPLLDTEIDITGVKKIEYEIFGDKVRER
jgi:hypothetical protein